MRILLTRPEPECSRTAAWLEGQGHAVVKAPLLRLEALPPPSITVESYRALAVTSARVAKLLSQSAEADGLKALPAYAVGDRSASALRRAGWRQVTSAQGAGADLARRMIADRITGRVLYASAETRSFDLAGALAEAGVACDSVDLYRMVPASVLPLEAVDALRGRRVDAIFLYSRRTAEVLVGLLDEIGCLGLLRDLRVGVMSEAVAVVLPDFAMKVVADDPTEAALLTAVLRMP